MQNCSISIRSRVAAILERARMTAERRISRVALLTLIALPLLSAPAQSSDQTGQSGGDLAIEATPLPRDQGRAFFEARGFSADISARIADACVLRLVLKNRATAKDIRVDLADWRTEHRMQMHPLRLEADWRQEWAQATVSPAAKIAFRYSLLPTAQTLAPGDWLQGMITADLRPGSAFDLRIAWSEDGKQRQTRLRGLRCAP